MAPFVSVNFADFWIGDQLNSLSIIFSDSVYYICYYMNFYSSDDFDESGRLSIQVFIRRKLIKFYFAEKVCLFKGKTYLIIRAVTTCLPAWFRFAQCLRRYHDDNRSLFPHVVNAGKYSTTFFVVLFSTLTELTVGMFMECLCFVLE